MVVTMADTMHEKITTPLKLVSKLHAKNSNHDLHWRIQKADQPAHLEKCHKNKQPNSNLEKIMGNMGFLTS